MISYYNGYTMQKNSEMELADTLFEDVNRDLHFLEKRLPEEEIAEKYRNFERGRIRILDRDGEGDHGWNPLGKHIGTGSQQGGQSIWLAAGVPDE